LRNSLTWLGDWRDSKPRVRQAVKATIAACVSYLIADFLGLPQAFWAAVVAIFVTQANIGASLGLAFDWFLGSLVGAVIGAAVAVLLGGSLPLRLVGLAGTVLVLGYFAAVRPQMRIACVNAAIIILGTPVFGPPLASAIIRVMEVVIGTVVAILTMLLVFPSRAGPALAAHITRTLPLYFQLASDLLTMAVTGRYEANTIAATSTKIRAAITANADLSRQAQTEAAGFLADSPNSEALLTALRRLWHTELMLARAVSVPLPASVQPRLREGLEELRDAIGALRVDMSEVDGDAEAVTPDIAEVEAAIGKLNSVVAQIRDSDELRTMPMDDAMRLMTLDFALEQLRQNLKDVANRRHELIRLAGSRIPWRKRLRRLLMARPS
jgi:uncharacterized membrane protein YgaE (UPF0421/DUF939 family)